MSVYDDLLKLLGKDDPPYSLTIATSIVEIVGHLEGIAAMIDTLNEEVGKLPKEESSKKEGKE